MKERIIKDRAYWLKRKEEVLSAEDSKKKQRELDKIDFALWKLGNVFYASDNHIPYRKKVENANDKNKERKNTENYKAV